MKLTKKLTFLTLALGAVLSASAEKKSLDGYSPAEQFVSEEWQEGESTARHRVSVSYIPLNAKESSINPILKYEQPKEIKSKKHVMFIYPDVRFQHLSGIGGCFNEMGGEALAALSKKQQSEVLDALFNTNTGSAFTFCRTAIGSSDFAFSAYSFSETPKDYEMKHFTTKRDKEYMLPYIQKAVKVNPEIRIFASPWSPPAWMKESGHMDKGFVYPDENGIINDPKIYEAYALYFSKYVQAYAKEGVKIERILVQNEQDALARFPSCRILIDQMTDFVKWYMRPQFEKDGINTEIWAGTFRTATEADGLRFAAHEKYRKHYAGMGLQYTTAQYIQDISRLAPDLKLMHTESACFNGANSAEEAKTRLDEVARYINGGSENFAYWNMILNETGTSGWGWKQNSLITIDRKAKSARYNPDYATMKLMSQFIKPNSQRIGSFSRSTLISTEYKGSYYLVLQNSSDKPIHYNCDIEGEKVVFEIPAMSLAGVEITK